MSRPSRTSLAIAAAAAALPLAAGITAPGGAQSPNGSRTLHFVATELRGFEGKGCCGAGSIVGFKDRIKTDEGTTGRDVGVCTISDLRRKESFCHVAIVLPDGQLVLEFLHRESAPSHTVAVTGGTGTYAGARGFAIAKDAGRNKTDITVNLSR